MLSNVCLSFFGADAILAHAKAWDLVLFKYRKYTAKVGQDNVNIGVVTIFRLANTSLLQVY